MKTPLLVLVMVIASTTLRATPGASDYVDVGKSRLVIVKVPAGTFRMGTDQKITAGENWTNEVERPVHEVKISRDFWMGKFAVTQGQWQEMMGNNPSYFKNKGPDAPGRTG